MARQAFFSFHYKPDNWRVSQVRNMGVIEGNSAVSDNDWESVTEGGDKAIEEWIADQLKSRSCTIVLVGENTSGRKWISYEIQESWNAKKGVVGVHIHNLKDSTGNQSQKGGTPFDYITVGGKKLSTIVPLYDSPYTSSTNVYDYINKNISEWVEEAIQIRNNY
jgi:hypothetical protein